MSMTRSHKQRGFMAIVLIVFLVVFVAIAASIVSMTTSGTRSAADHVQASAALFMAESGIEWAALELFDAADPAAECAALAGQSAPVNGQGTFRIDAATYQAAEGNCRITSLGLVGATVRTLKGVIPKSVLDGDSGGGDDLFEDSDENFTNCGQQNLDCVDGSMTFERPSGGGGVGNTNTQANGSDLITDDFTVGDTVYFTANFQWDPADNPGGNIFNIELTQGIADCSVSLPTLFSACAAPTGGEADALYDVYDVVLVLGDNFEPQDVNKVKLRVDWGPNVSDWVTLSEGCIGRAGHCAGAAGDDPVEDGTWDEDP